MLRSRSRNEAGVEKTPKKGAAPPPKKGAGKGKGPAPSPKAKALAKEAAVEPRKPLVKPGVAVKRLFWSPMFLNAEGDTVWHAIDQEGAAIDTAELEFLFAEKGALGPRTAASPHGQDPPAATKLRVLDEPRRRSVCVMLARLPPARETVAAVSGLAEAALDRDQVELLLMNLPPIEERNMLKAAREAAATPELSAWDTAEQFLLLLIEVPRYEQRLRVWGFECSYAERLADLAGAEAELRAGCEVVLRSVALQHLLGLALFAGNFLNGGTTRGRADGFALEVACMCVWEQGRMSSLEGSDLGACGAFSRVVAPLEPAAPEDAAQAALRSGATSPSCWAPVERPGEPHSMARCGRQ